MIEVISIQEAVDKVKDGMSIMVGGFIGSGAPGQILSELAEANLKELTLIANDTGILGDPLSQMVVNHRLRKVIASHIGTNKETGRQMNTGDIEVSLVPQGTLAERIRAAGAGLGGVLTPTGIGTLVEEGKQKVCVDGREFLLEVPLSADVAILKAHKADRAGNLVYRRAARNFNPLMATAAEVVIVEVEKIVEIGELDPDEVMTPGIFVDYLVLSQSAEVKNVG